MGNMKTDIGNECIMLVGSDCTFYLGLLGPLSLRTFGSFTIYTSLERPFRICLDGQRWEQRDIAVVPPYVPHRIQTSERVICSTMLEPESIDLSRFPSFVATNSTGKRGLISLERIRAAYAHLQQIGVGEPVEGINTDQLFFGQDLITKTLDPRIERIVEKIKSDPSSQFTAEECAEEAKLSSSRFLHLFKAETGVPFRKFRAWKRARNLLYHVGRSDTLTDIALEIGYPDSTHFSHSIRQFYGLRPSEIFAGSRRLGVLIQKPAIMRCGLARLF